MKPPLAYYGAKVTIAQRIVDLLPLHGHYVEPFAGSLAVLLAKRPSTMETVNDLDARLMTFWRILRDRPADLERACALTPHSRAEYTAVQRDMLTDHPVPADHPDPDLELARRVWLCLTQGRAGTLRSTGWRFYINPAGSNTSMPGYLDGYVNRMAAAVERLARVSLEHRPALDLIDAYGTQPDVLLYVDPPYLGSTRFRNYRHEMGAERDHRELAEHLAACRAAVVLSDYPSPLYDGLYAGWDRREIATATGQAAQWSARTEVVWSNRPFPDAADGLFTAGALA